MGYVLAYGVCFVCGEVFSFNPHKVPSMRVGEEREPVCKNCMDIANARREQMGLKPLPVAPDAYEAIDENEL